jgi:carbon-monoxide dehydrogenase medium subunit
VLIALGASVAVMGPKGERMLALEDLFTGYMETSLEKNELISQVSVPAQRAKKAAYCKVTTGSADDWPALGVAVSLEADGGAVKSVRVVVSAATVKAMRLTAAEKVLTGARIDDKTLANAGEAAVSEAECIADVRGSAPYKRELLRVYIGRAVRQAMGGA